MEEYRNRVINLHAIKPRLLVNLPVKLTRMNPKGLGGAMGGYPCEPPRGCIRPRGGAAYGQGCHHILGGQRPMLGLPQGGDCGIMTQQGPWAPPAGGGRYTLERLAGVSAPPTIP